jgi:hypothetical protein
MPRYAVTLAVAASAVALRASAQATYTYTSGTPLASKVFSYPDGIVRILPNRSIFPLMTKY